MKIRPRTRSKRAGILFIAPLGATIPMRRRERDSAGKRCSCHGWNLREGGSLPLCADWLRIQGCGPTASPDFGL